METINIYVEGNIGTGKSTFLKYLEDNLPKDKFNMIYEPVDQWTNLTDSQGKNILEHFYEDQNAWAFPFQMNSFISRVKNIEEVSQMRPKRINIIERSVYTDRNCFALNCFNDGKINEIEFKVYTQWHDWLCKHFNIKPSGFIYIKTPPNECSERILRRSRGGEGGIPVEYLTNLGDLHDQWLDKEENVFNIEMEHNLYDNKEKMDKIMEDLKEYLDKLN